MRLIHYKVVDGFGLVKHEHNYLVGGIGPLTATGINLVIRKISKEQNVPTENVIIANIMDILEKEEKETK